MRATRATSGVLSRGIGAFRSLILAGAVVVLLVGAYAGVHTAGERARATLVGELSDAATAHANAISLYFSRAREVNLLAAQNAVFRTPAHHEHPGAQLTSDGEVAAALSYIEALYPGQISEACIIDASGAESARVVSGHHAAPHELSKDEAANPFFAPTFALDPGHVYQATPYVSPDTQQWVISNSTPIPGVTGGRPSILHFEVSLASFGAALRSVDPSRVVQIVDARNGQVVLDSREPSGVALAEPASGATATSRVVKVPEREGASATEGIQTFVTAVTTAPGNANRWVVMVSAPTAGVTLGAVGTESLLLMVVALVLLGLAAAGFRADRRRLTAAALTDPLSGLPNRVQFAARLTQAIEHTRRSDREVAVGLLDLNHFKDINDTLGHHAGDALLAEVAGRIAASLGGAVTVARLGGDEFALLFAPVADRAAVTEAVSVMLNALNAPAHVGGSEIAVGGSVGLAFSPEHGTTVDDLLRRADIAMYRAKRTTADLVIYHPDLDMHSLDRLALMAEVRRAIDDEQLVIHYQPKIALAGGAPVGAEALVRWEHPQRGLLFPSQFLPIVEELGLEFALTAAVVRQALRQCRSWLDAGLAMPIAVNLPARCAQDVAIVDLVASELTRFDLPASMLRLEITETSFLGDTDRALEVLLRLEDLGVLLSIDDYGTGYSSLAYLRRLPVHEIKIDRVFVHGLADNRTNADIVRSTIDLGHRLGFAVAAEGVEDAATAAALAAAGCDVAQGFFYSRPLSAVDLAAWVRSHGQRHLDLTVFPSQVERGTDARASNASDTETRSAPVAYMPC